MFAFTDKANADLGAKLPLLSNQDLIILDLGCGWGRITLELAKRHFLFTGVDLSPNFIEYARSMAKAKGSRKRGIANITWMVGRAEEQEAESDSFELITVSEAFHRLDQRLIL